MWQLRLKVVSSCMADAIDGTRGNCLQVDPYKYHSNFKRVQHRSLMFQIDRRITWEYPHPTPRIKTTFEAGGNRARSRGVTVST